MNESSTLDRADGPFDSDEVAIPENYLDFGCLLLPRPPADVIVKLEVEEGTSRGIAVTIQFEASSLQLSLFSAPKSSGIWSEVMSQMELSLANQGAEVAREAHAFGQSLRVTQLGEDQSKQDLRFIGVDGPRWLLRGVLSGPAVTDSAEGAFLESILKATIVRRGGEAMPPRELIALTLPPGVVAPPRSV